MAGWTGQSLGRDVPLYEAVAEQLAALGRDAGPAGSAKLPSERVLCEKLNVSRITVRRALAHLAERGVVAAQRGRGWYLVGEMGIEPPGALVSLTEVGRRSGFTVTAKVLKQEVRSASIEEAERLGVVPGSRVLDLRRLRKFDDVEIALHDVIVPIEIAPGLENVDFTTASLYGTLESVFGIIVQRGLCSIESRQVDHSHAPTLGVPVGSAALVIRQVGYDQHDRLVELSEMTYRGDRYRFRTVLSRQPRTL